MTLRDFSDGLRSYSRLGWALLGVTGLAVLGYAVAMTIFRDSLIAAGEQFLGRASAELVPGLAGVPVIVIMLGGSALVQWIASKDRRLVCPDCRRLVVQPAARRMVVTSGCCRFCGGQVIDRVETRT